MNLAWFRAELVERSRWNVACHIPPPPPLPSRTTPRRRRDRFSTSSLTSAQCLELLLYRVIADINFRAWQDSSRRRDILVNGEAANVFHARWHQWVTTDEDGRALVDFLMRRITFHCDLDEFITQLNKYSSTSFPHYPISAVDAAIASFSNQRAARYGRLPGPGYRCDSCGGAHLKERCPEIAPQSIVIEIIGIARFRCDPCGREWRSDNTGLFEDERGCMCCRRPARRLWFVETCSSACPPHCTRIAHAHPLQLRMIASEAPESNQRAARHSPQSFPVGYWTPVPRSQQERPGKIVVSAAVEAPVASAPLSAPEARLVPDADIRFSLSEKTSIWSSMSNEEKAKWTEMERIWRN